MEFTLVQNDLLKGIWPEWEIVGKLGQGSFGVVYKAVRHDYQVESEAAIKVISIPQHESEIDSLRADGLSEEASRTYFQGIVNDFVNEIQLMESLKGQQNIVSIEDYKVVEKQGEIGWNIYIRMELLTPYNSYIRNQSLTEEEVIKLGCDICSALELCAKRNIIHRDVKPENIFINSFGNFKLGDFGIARKLEGITGMLSSKKGTYNYMAPEVYKGNHYDATADIYSLGLVLYRLLNKNRLPFLDTEQQLLNPDERVKAAERRMSGEQLPAPCEASPEMTALILCACAYDPRQRFQSATAMKKALENMGTWRVHPAQPEPRPEPDPKPEPDEDVTPRVNQPIQSVLVGDRTPRVSRPKQSEIRTDSKSELKPQKALKIVIAAICAVVIAVGGLWFVLRDNDNEAESTEEVAEEVEPTAEDAVTTEQDEVPPATLTNLAASPYGTGATCVSWDAATDAQSYEAQYFNTSANEWENVLEYEGGTSFIFTGLASYESCNFRVRAVNTAGYSEWAECTYTPSVPDAPQNLTATAYDMGSAQVSWSGSQGAESYEVQYYSPLNAAWKDDTSYEGGTSYISTGLVSYDSYQFRVRAVNMSGYSEWVTCSVSVPLPSMPTNFTASLYGTDSALLSWTESEYAEYYEAQFYGQASGTWKDDPDYESGTTYISTGLTSYVSYRFRVRAVNVAGCSDWAYVTLNRPITRPSAPTNFTVSMYDTNSALLLWDGVSDATYYEVQYYSQANGAWKDDPDYGGGTSYVSTGLTSYVSYEYRVRAVNAAGCSEWVNCTYTRDIAPPSEPKNFMVSPYDTESAQVSWDGSSDAAYYEVQYYSQTSGAWQNDTDYESGTTYISTGLTSYDYYQFRVRAVNAAGCSEWVEYEYYIAIEQ